MRKILPVILACCLVSACEPHKPIATVNESKTETPEPGKELKTSDSPPILLMLFFSIYPVAAFAAFIWYFTVEPAEE